MARFILMRISVNNAWSVGHLSLQFIVENSSSSNLLHAVVASQKCSHTSKNWYSAGSCSIVYSHWLPVTEPSYPLRSCIQQIEDTRSGTSCNWITCLMGQAWWCGSQVILMVRGRPLMLPWLSCPVLPRLAPFSTCNCSFLIAISYITLQQTKKGLLTLILSLSLCSPHMHSTLINNCVCWGSWGFVCHSCNDWKLHMDPYTSECVVTQVFWYCNCQESLLSEHHPQSATMHAI